MLRSNDLHEAIDPERFYIFPTAGGDSKQEFSESSLVLQLEVFLIFPRGKRPSIHSLRSDT